MTARITPDLDNTREIVESILPFLMQDQRVAFTCPAGEAEQILNRIRVMISRTRKKLRQRNRKPREFLLMSTVHPETHDGIRLDCIVLERKQTEVTRMNELFEDIMAKDAPKQGLPIHG